MDETINKWGEFPIFTFENKLNIDHVNPKYGYKSASDSPIWITVSNYSNT